LHNNLKLTTFIGYAIPKRLKNTISEIGFPDFIIVAERNDKLILGDLGLDNLEHRTTRLRKILKSYGLEKYCSRLFCFVEV